MPPTRRSFLGTAAMVAVAGCLGNGDDAGQNEPTATATRSPTATDTPTDSPTATDTPTDSPASTTTVRLREHEEHGDILVGSDGMTLYMFEQDTQGAEESACTEGCAEAWPPLTVPGDVEAGVGVTADLATFEREDGDRQVTADGWPLYFYAEDEAPGDTNGQGVGDVWWVLAGDGTPQASTTTATGTATPTGMPTATATPTATEGSGGDDGGPGY